MLHCLQIGVTMNFAEKLKTLRKQKALSQEQLAEKIHVSRQAITKWECGTGLPDIANLIAISSLFNESLDSLVSEEKSLVSKNEFLYESRTEYDLDGKKRIDLKVGVAHEIIIEKNADEKILVCAASNQLLELSSLVKVKIIEDRWRMDVKVHRSAKLSDTAAKEQLFILVRIPEKFVADVELSSHVSRLRIRDMSFGKIEFSGKAEEVFVTNASGCMEFDTNSNLNVELDGAKGRLCLNQIHATSKISMKNGTEFCLENAGRFTRFVDSDSKIISSRRTKKKHGNAPAYRFGRGTERLEE